ncbi:hypothetical protein X777_07638 [Ooceraea biroi]|uniref:GAG-pre-integrase domain-containing protein n=1 Tax=Ooceraea biroi TaxID=2015173 RepID=A0A026WBC5_OOCBI|nr:hypothetical protein X777_07638 [Ooceraea biroi]
MRKSTDPISRANNLLKKGNCLAMSVNQASNEIDEWHYKLGHLNERDLKDMKKTVLYMD